MKTRRKNPEDMTTLAVLMPDLIDIILTKLEPADLTSMFRVSKYFNNRLHASHTRFWRTYASLHPLKPDTKEAEWLWLMGKYASAGHLDQIDCVFLLSLIKKDETKVLSYPLVKNNQPVLDRLYQLMVIPYSIQSISAAGENSNRTILFWACAFNQPQQVRMLISAGAGMQLTIHGEMIELKNDHSNTLFNVLTLLIINSYSEVIQILLDNGVSATAWDNKRVLDMNANLLIKAIQHNQLTIIKSLLEHGVDANISLASGLTPLWLAAFLGEINILKLLLDHGANPSIHSQLRVPVLLKITKSERPESLERVRVYFKDYNQDPVMISALEIAKIMGHTQIVTLLERKIESELSPKYKRNKL